MAHIKSPALIASLCLALSAVIWGAAFPVSKFVLGNMDALTMTLIRYGLAAPLFLALLAWREGAGALRTEGAHWRLLGLGTLGFAGFNLLMFYAVGMSRPEFGAVVMALQPLIAVLIHALRTRTRPNARTGLALGLAVLGVVLLTTNGDLSRLTRHAAVLPTLMMIAGGACWILYSMGAAAFPQWSPLRYTALSGAAGGLALLLMWIVVGLVAGLRVPAVDALPALTPALLYLTLLAAVLAVLSWNMGIRTLGAQRGMLFINLVPLTALLIGVLRGHALGYVELIGAALVVVSLVLNQLAVMRSSVIPAKVPATSADSLRPALLAAK